ncbi:hypothetical protein AVEN_212119-2-1, partial [Araneus ventricosus]
TPRAVPGAALAWREFLIWPQWRACIIFPTNYRLIQGDKKISALYSFRAQSVRNHPINRLSLPAGLRRLYAARPSHILPLCERTKMLLHDWDLNDSVQLSDFFTFPPWDSPQFSFLNPFSGFDKSTTAPITFQQLFHHHRYRYSSFVPIFTDGSKSDGHVGCGVVFPSDTLSYRLHNCCSVFTAELVAIFCALQEISPSSQRKFIIYTDSMSALESLSHYDNRIHPVALEILSVLKFLRNKGFSIIFCWVPSHVGISGNETADVIARFASDFLQRALSYCDIKKSLVSHLMSAWQQKWNLLTRNKLYSVKPSIGLWSALPMREFDVKLTRLRIGHTRFTHRHLFLGQRAPRCPTCQVDFTVNHILIECPSFKCHREYHFNSSSVTLQDLVGMQKEEYEEWMLIAEDIPVAATPIDLEICQAVCEQDQVIKVDDSEGDECVEENPSTNAEMRQALAILKRGVQHRSTNFEKQ